MFFGSSYEAAVAPLEEVEDEEDVQPVPGSPWRLHPDDHHHQINWPTTEVIGSVDFEMEINPSIGYCCGGGNCFILKRKC